MLLIYTRKITPRITYAFKHVCTTVLGIPVKFTSVIEEFVAHDEMKLSYGRKALGNEFFVQNVDLLLEQGFSDTEIKLYDWDGLPCFFPLAESSAVPFDIFAASFYFLSRYEEYLPHVKDSEGRYPANESLAYQEGFLEMPIVDFWAFRFKELLQEKYPEEKFPSRSFKTLSIISVSEAYCYKNKGVIRVMAGFLSHLLQFKVKYVVHRLRVMLNLKKDPYDIYPIIIKFLKKYKIPLKFMFQVSDFSTYDKNTNPNRLNFQSLIKSMADYAEVGLQAGYYANEELAVLKKEKFRLEDILKRTVESSVNVGYSLHLPDAYQNLMELEFKKDYSMGYPEVLGFRAGTCTPFLFYDLNLEVTTPLMLYPYAINSNAFLTLKEADIETKSQRIKQHVQSVGGSLIGIFSNVDFSEYSNAKRNYRILRYINENS